MTTVNIIKGEVVYRDKYGDPSPGQSSQRAALKLTEFLESAHRCATELFDANTAALLYSITSVLRTEKAATKGSVANDLAALLHSPHHTSLAPHRQWYRSPFLSL